MTAPSLLTPSGDDGAATPSVPSRVTLPDHIAHEGTCQFPNRDEALSAGPSRTNLAPALALSHGRAPISLHPCKSSAVNPCGDPEIITRGFQHVGKVFQKTGN